MANLIYRESYSSDGQRHVTHVYDNGAVYVFTEDRRWSEKLPSIFVMKITRNTRTLKDMRTF